MRAPSALSFDDIVDDLVSELAVPVEDPETVVVAMLRQVWNTAFAAGAIKATQDGLTRRGRIKRLQALWPLSDETITEFQELLFLGETTDP